MLPSSLPFPFFFLPTFLSSFNSSFSFFLSLFLLSFIPSFFFLPTYLPSFCPFFPPSFFFLSSLPPSLPPSSSYFLRLVFFKFLPSRSHRVSSSCLLVLRSAEDTAGCCLLSLFNIQLPLPACKSWNCIWLISQRFREAVLSVSVFSAEHITQTSHHQSFLFNARHDRGERRPLPGQQHKSPPRIFELSQLSLRLKLWRTQNKFVFSEAISLKLRPDN